LSPFSNTVGYFFAYVTGVNSLFKSILKDRKTLNLGPKQADMLTAINNVYEDKSLLINSMTLTNLPLWWENMSKGGLLKQGANNTHYKDLMGFIKLKTEIAEFMWYALTGVLVTSVSYNSIVNSGCSQSVEEMEKRHDEYLEKEKQINDDKQKKSDSQIVYKTYE
jgi:septin family protein